VDLPLALGEAVGAAVFVCTFCMAMVIMVSPMPIVVASGPYTRDALAYLVALTLTAEAIVDSNFELQESLFLVLWYFDMVIMLSISYYHDINILLSWYISIMLST
jgi:Ca2+/Na+ antiporter